MTPSVAARVSAKRVYQPAERSDGLRILVTRYWPRGIARNAVDEYVPTLAPSRELLRGYRSGEISWAHYRERFLDEMKGESQQAQLRRLANIARAEPITILCVCDDPEKCHRWLVRDLLTAFEED